MAIAILGFVGAGLGTIIGSAATTGWSQAVLINIGTSLLIVGTVELGVLGVLRNVLETKDKRLMIEVADTAALASLLGTGVKVIQPAPIEAAGRTSEIAASLRDLANRLDGLAQQKSSE